MSVRFELKELSPVRRELRVEVEAERVAEELDHVLGEVAGSARLPGFRPGKVPRAILRKRFAREIENELLEHLAGPALAEALKGTESLPLHQPVVRDVVLEDGKPLAFTASFEVRPRIEPRDYLGLRIEVPELRVEDADVARELDRLREEAATYTAVDPRPLARGDFALVDLQRGGERDGQRQHDALIEIGAEEYHPEFTRNLLGVSPGETRSFEVSYGEDEPDPGARGKSVSYQVHLREIKKKVLPELDDEFAKDGGRFATLAELKASLRRDLERAAEHRLRAEQEARLAHALVPSVEGEMPQALIETELDLRVQAQLRRLAARGVDPRTVPIDWRSTRDRMRGDAVDRVKWELLLDAIAAKEGIDPTPAEIDAALGRIAEVNQKSVEFVRARLAKEGRLDEIRESERRRAVVDFLLRNAKIEKGARR